MKKLILMIFLLLFLVGCGTKNEFAGTYYYFDAKTGLKENIYYDFKDDNTGTYAFINDSRTFTYSINDDVLKIVYNDKNMRVLETKFKLEGKVLKFKNSFGEDVTYKKR